MTGHPGGAGAFACQLNFLTFVLARRLGEDGPDGRRVLLSVGGEVAVPRETDLANELLGVIRNRLLRRLAQFGLIEPAPAEEPVVFEPLPDDAQSD